MQPGSRSARLLLGLCLLAEAPTIAKAEPFDIHGLYRTAEGQAKALFPAPLDINQTAMMDMATGQVRVLFPADDETDAFTFGPSMGVSMPIRGKITLRRDRAGHVEDFELSGEDGAVQMHRRIALRHESMAFSNGPIQLAGTLLMPEGSGPFPGIVMLHGSRPETREGNLGMALFMVSRGVAALIFDKRGVGESSRVDWRAPFEAYAEDALAGFASLRAHKQVDAGRVGFWGHSQGAWIAALAASRTKEAAFVILECGGAVDPADQMMWSTRRRLECSTTLTPKEIDACQAYRQIKFDVAAGRRSLLEFQSQTALVRNEPWFPHVTDRLPPSVLVKYDAGEPLAALNHCAILAVFAEHDESTPTRQSVETLTAALARANHPANLVRTVAGANHAFLESLGGKLMEQEGAELDRFRPEYFEILTEWLNRTVCR